MTMTCHVERYVALKRHLGFRFVRQGRILGTYAKHADDHGDEIILCSRMIEAATRGGILQTVRQRLAISSEFCVVAPLRRRTPRSLAPECAWPARNTTSNAMPDDAGGNPEGDGRRARPSPCRFDHTVQLPLHDWTCRGHGNASKRSRFVDDIGSHPRWCCYPGDKVQENEARSVARYGS